MGSRMPICRTKSIQHSDCTSRVGDSQRQFGERRVDRRAVQLNTCTVACTKNARRLLKAPALHATECAAPACSKTPRHAKRLTETCKTKEGSFVGPVGRRFVERNHKAASWRISRRRGRRCSWRIFVQIIDLLVVSQGLPHVPY